MKRATYSTHRQLELLHAQQASEWIELLREAGPDRRAEFVSWLKQSPRHVSDVLGMISVEQALDQIDSKHLLDVKLLLAQVSPSVVPLQGPMIDRTDDTGLPADRRSRRAAALAAGLIGTSVVAGLLWSAGGWIADRQSWKDYQTAISEQRAFELADGSVIYLNTNSRVSVRFTAAARTVRLEQGEALFRVLHDESRPFRVATKDVVIQDLGTQFNVYDRSDRTVVAVIEGSVAVMPAATRVPSHALARASDTAPAPGPGASSSSPVNEGRVLAANDEAQIGASGVVTVRTMPNVAEAVAWRERRLVFRDESLARIVEEFNRYGTRKIRLEGAAIGERVYSGVFDADDPDSLAEVLARERNLVIERTSLGILIKER